MQSYILHTDANNINLKKIETIHKHFTLNYISTVIKNTI